MRQVNVNLPVMSLPQAIEIEPSVSDRGAKVAQMLVAWPMTAMMIEITEETARAIITKLEGIFGEQQRGLHIARDLPPDPGSNSHP